MTIEFLVFLLLAIILFKEITPIITFLICFYIGFKLVYKDDNIERRVIEYIKRKLENL